MQPYNLDLYLLSTVCPILSAPYALWYNVCRGLRELVCEATFEPGVEAYLAMGTQW